MLQSMERPDTNDPCRTWITRLDICFSCWAIAYPCWGPLATMVKDQQIERALREFRYFFGRRHDTSGFDT